MPSKPAEPKCYMAHEVARMLGMSHDTLYRAGMIEKLYAQGMPRSLTLGRYRFPRAAFDAWVNRDHPLQPRRPANDVDGVPIAPSSNAEWRAFLCQNYARQR